MPLRDHFRRPVTSRHSWEGLHARGGWPYRCNACSPTSRTPAAFCGSCDAASVRSVLFISKERSDDRGTNRSKISPILHSVGADRHRVGGDRADPGGVGHSRASADGPSPRGSTPGAGGGDSRRRAGGAPLPAKPPREPPSKMRRDLAARVQAASIGAGRSDLVERLQRENAELKESVQLLRRNIERLEAGHQH